MSKWEVIHGDCLEVLRGMAANSIDAVVCDPPYGLSFMGKRWDYDVPSVDVWAEVLRVLKPGGYLLAFAGTRTQHRMAVRIEDAGFEIRDMIAWVYGSGFPKSMDVSKAIDKAAGAEREVVGSKIGLPGYHLCGHDGGEAFGHGLSSSTPETRAKSAEITAPATDAARQWSGWGTALKPAMEPITVARKPLVGTVAANVQEWGTGAINVDACRIPSACEHTDGGSTGDSGYGRRGGQRTHTDHTSCLLERSPQLSPSSALPSSVLGCENQQTQPQDSPRDCPPCRRCDGVPVRPSQVDGQASSLQPRGEREPLCRCATEPNIRECLSTCHQYTARHVETQGRWPANLIHDGSDEVVGVFPVTTSGTGAIRKNAPGQFGLGGDGKANIEYGDSGSSARFFYCAKASKAERDAGLDGMEETTSRHYRTGNIHNGHGGRVPDKSARNHHPTVKPAALMAYLCRLVTPPGGTILDPFVGSGSTGIAAIREGFNFVGIEREAEYVEIARRRIAHEASKAPIYSEAAQ